MLWSRAWTLEPDWFQILLWTISVTQFPHRREIIITTSQPHCEGWELMIIRYLEQSLAYCKDLAITGFFLLLPLPIFIVIVIFQCFQTIFCFLECYAFSMIVVLGWVYLLVVSRNMLICASVYIKFKVLSIVFVLLYLWPALPGSQLPSLLWH